jgi:homoserine kinase
MAGAMFRAAPVRVRVPATAANLGPGFDACGLALGLYDDIVVQVTESGLDVQVAGEGADSVPVGERHLVVKAMRAAFKVLGGQPRGLALRCANRVPHGRGLGSSAAAIVSGLVAARSLVVGGADRMDDLGLLRLATQLEGHPDNVAACLHGGLTISWTPLPAGPGPDPDPVSLVDGPAPGPPPSPRMVRLPVLAEIEPVVFVAEESLATQTARGALPAAVPHRDAAANAARSALLVAALTRVPDVLFDATQDFLHQPYRATVMPRTADLLRRLRAAGVAAVVSGAGPSVLAFTVAGQPSPDLVDSIAAETGIGWRISPLAIDRQGATLQTAVPGERPRDSAR